MSFRDWQQAGFDLHSEIANHLFMDPQHDDYALCPASIAFELGFGPFDISQVVP